MAREAFFKARIEGPTDEGWVEGQFQGHGDNASIMAKDGSLHRVREETVSEFTGILCPDKDKGFGEDGNYLVRIPLFENDIVEFRDRYQYYDGYEVKITKIGERFICTYSGAGFVLVPEDMYASWDNFGRIPSTVGIMRSYDVWNCHSFYIPVSNLYD